MYKFVNLRTRIVMYGIDALGCLAWWLWRLLRPWTWRAAWNVFVKFPLSPARILLVRVDYIGDVLLTTHTFRAIRERYPHAAITMLCSEKGAEILYGNPYIDHIITYNPPWFFKKPWQSALQEYWAIRKRIWTGCFDVGIDFRGDVRNIALLLVATSIPWRISFAASGGWYLLQKNVPYIPGLHEAEYHTHVAQALGASLLDTDLPQIFPSAEDRHRVDLFFAHHNLEMSPQNTKPLIAIVPGARKEVRLWPVERYATVARVLMEEYGARIILIGTVQDQGSLDAINALLSVPALCSAHELTNLRQLYELLRRCSLFIGVSSGPSHIAAAASLPSVLLFGPELQSQWRPLGPTQIIQHIFPCMPCTQKTCPNMKSNCIQAISTAEVLDKARLIIDSLCIHKS